MSPTDADRDRDGTLWITTVHYATLYIVQCTQCLASLAAGLLQANADCLD